MVVEEGGRSATHLLWGWLRVSSLSGCWGGGGRGQLSWTDHDHVSGWDGELTEMHVKAFLRVGVTLLIVH